LALIARAAEGSARDGLSILDQAIAHGGGAVSAARVRAMLGLSDRGAVRALLGLLLAGDAPGALAALKDQYDLGVEPTALLRGLLEAVHGIARAKVGGADDPAQAAEERAAYADWAARLGFAAIHRLWQMLLKGLGEIEAAPAPLEASEMALLRVIHAADLPDPGELAAKLARGEAVSAAAPAPAGGGDAGQGQGALLAMPADFPAMIALLERHGSHQLALQLHDRVGLVDYAPPDLVIRPAKPLPGTFARDLAGALKAATGSPWRVRLTEDEAQPSLRAQELSAEAVVREQVLAAPVVRAAFAAFPDAELVGYDLQDKRSA
jgi:DNA polymerase-3 subunit gamma/tau